MSGGQNVKPTSAPGQIPFMSLYQQTQINIAQYISERILSNWNVIQMVGLGLKDLEGRVN